MRSKAIQLERNPLLTANVFSRICFHWLSPLMTLGNKEQLRPSDMFQILDYETSVERLREFETEWDDELLRKGKHSSLTRTLIRLHWQQFFLYGVLALLEEMIKVAQPLFLAGLVQYFAFQSDTSVTEACLYALGIGICSFMVVCTHHIYFFGVLRLGMALKVSCSALLYKKTLRLSNAALLETTTGQIVNLLSNDVQRFDLMLVFANYLWIAPCQAVFAAGLLAHYLGFPAWTGLALLIIVIPIQIHLGSLFARLRRATAKCTDERVKIMNEVVSGMRVIKMYCWELPFSNLVSAVRNQECLKIGHRTMVQLSNGATYYVSFKICLMLTFIPIVLEQISTRNSPAPNTVKAQTKNFTDCIPTDLTPVLPRADVLFMVYTLFNALRLTWFMFVPNAFQLLQEGLVILGRLEDFLTLPELADLPQSQEKIEINSDEKSTKKFIRVENMTASWEKACSPQKENLGFKHECTTLAEFSSSSFMDTLTDISFTAKSGDLVMILGGVASGKSSILMALLRELPIKKYKCFDINGSIAYVGQQPWIFSDSLRENILFGKEYDQSLYKLAVSSCALDQDIAAMKDGDRTEIGERGVTLSGGQRARVALARAVYANADIYLLDDPLSAVDASVAKHLFEQCIGRALKHKIKVLVTHQLQFLQSADQIITLKDGKMERCGSYEELVVSGVDLASLIADENQESENQDLDEDHRNNDCVRRKISSDNNCVHRKISSGSVKTKRMEAGDVNHQDCASLAVTYRNGSTRVQRSTSTVSRISAVSHASGVSRRQSWLGRSSPISFLGVSEFHTALDELHEGQEEVRHAGAISWRRYWNYFVTGGGWCGVLSLVLIHVVTQSAYLVSDWWLARWSNAEENRTRALDALFRDYNRNLTPSLNISNGSSTGMQANVTYNCSAVDFSSLQVVDPIFNLWMYGVLVLIVAILAFVRAGVTASICVSAGRRLHRKMFERVVNSPIRFFDTNSSGRILNRFSKDTGNMDDMVPITFYDFSYLLALSIGNTVYAAVIVPWVLIPIVPLLVMLVLIRRYSVRVTREIKRLDGTMKSPVIAHISATLDGLQVIRSYQQQERFISLFHQLQDNHTASRFLDVAVQRWFGFRLDLLCAILVSIFAFLCIAVSGNASGGDIGLSLAYVMGLMGTFQFCVRQSAEWENHMISVERVMEYAELPQEAAKVVEDQQVSTKDWPKKGKIRCESVSYDYGDGVNVLKDLNCVIESKEKIGIVGRTGAGKSSLINMLFRMNELQGSLTIDGVDVSKIGLHDLRSKISIIPQEPVLFSGSVRKNLDPFNDHDNLALYQALEEVQLKEAIDRLPGGLDHQFTEGGSNMSVGQRQLVCLARALLRNNRILVIDEATANVDQITDALIQATIRDKFSQCTVLTIAHRLNTIMDSDRILVMDAGTIAEFDEPYVLIQRPGSRFRDIVDQTGKENVALLEDIARKAYERKRGRSLGKDDEDQLEEVEESYL